MSISYKSIILGVLVITMSGCVLGPQPEPPDVTEEPNADVDVGLNDRFYGEGDDEAVPGAESDGAYCPCDPGLAGGEWNCDDDRDGHEPPDQDSISESGLDGFNGRILMPDVRERFFGDDGDDDPDPIDETSPDATDSDDDEEEEEEDILVD